MKSVQQQKNQHIPVDRLSSRKSMGAPVRDWLRMIRHQTLSEDDVHSTLVRSTHSSLNPALVRDSIFQQLLLDLSYDPATHHSVSSGQDDPDMTNWLRQSFCSCLNGGPSAEDDPRLDLVANQSIASIIQQDDCITQEGFSIIAEPEPEELLVQEIFSSLEDQERVKNSTGSKDQEDDVEVAVPKRKRPSRFLSPLSLKRISEVSYEKSPELHFAVQTLIRLPFFEELVTRHLPTLMKTSHHRYSQDQEQVDSRKKTTTTTPLVPSCQARRCCSWPISLATRSAAANQPQQLTYPVARIVFHSRTLDKEPERLLACANICQTLSSSDTVLWRASDSPDLDRCTPLIAAAQHVSCPIYFFLVLNPVNVAEIILFDLI